MLVQHGCTNSWFPLKWPRHTLTGLFLHILPTPPGRYVQYFHQTQTQNTNTPNDANKLVYYPSTSRGDRFSGTFVSHTNIIYRTSLGLTVSQFSQMQHRNFPYPCAYFVICSTPRAVPQHAHHKSRPHTIREVWKHNGGGRAGGGGGLMLCSACHCGTRSTTWVYMRRHHHAYSVVWITIIIIIIACALCV